MTTPEERFQKGMDIRRQLAGGGPIGGSARAVSQLAPDLERLATECIFGSIWTRPGLDIKYRSMATISVLTVLGREPQLKGHIGNGLNLGITPEQMVEIFIHLVFDGGAPASLNALRLTQEVFDQRGISFAPPPSPVPASSEERRQKGAEFRRKLYGIQRNPPGAQAAEALIPDALALLEEYRFGSVWQRPALDIKSRLVCSLSAMAVMGREPQLGVHIRAALNVGLTQEEIGELFLHIALYAGFPFALTALRIAKDVFDQAG